MSIFWLNLGDRVYKLSGLGELCDTKVRRKIPRVSLERIKNNNLNLVDIEINAIVRALKMTKTQKEAAVLLNISEMALSRRIIKHNLKRST